MARRLTEQIGPIERRYGLRFEPSYPGVTAGVESASGTLRLVLACKAYTSEEKPLGVVFTAPDLWPTTPGVGGAGRGACSQGMARVG